MKLTARQALEIGQELWEWLEGNPDKEKDKWPGWEKYGEMQADCPLCEYDHQEDNDCSKCLIYWRSKLGMINDCCRADTPYGKWCDAVGRPRSERFWAGRVAKLHREALERLER